MGNAWNEMFFWLLVAHAVTDFPLQGDFLAKAKNWEAPIPGVPWYTCLAAHALISGGGVALVTGSVFTGLMEMACHFVIDWARCTKVPFRFTGAEPALSFNQDQILHVVCKAFWATIVWYPR